MRKSLLRKICPALLLIAAPAAHASQVLLNSLGNAQTGGPTTLAAYIHDFPGTDDLSVAVSFSVPTNSFYQLDSIDLYVAARFSASQHLTVSIDQNAVNIPGTTIDSYSLTNLPVRPDGPAISLPLTTLSTSDHPLLNPGQTYWIVLSTPDASNNSDIYWFINPNNVTGTFLDRSASLNGNGWLGIGTINTLPSLRINATAVPLPPAAFASLLFLPLFFAARRTLAPRP